MVGEKISSCCNLSAMQGWPCWPEEGQTVKHSLYAIGTKELAYGLCKIWPLSPGFGHYKENSWAFNSLWLHLLGTKTSFLWFALVLPRTTELHPLHARGGAMDAHTLLLCNPVPSQSLPSCILVLTSRLASDQPYVKKKPTKHVSEVVFLFPEMWHFSLDAVQTRKGRIQSCTNVFTPQEDQCLLWSSLEKTLLKYMAYSWFNLEEPQLLSPYFYICSCCSAFCKRF